ncbi:MAG: 2-oxo-4-hydroxy-4-carboxy-5-ureidoimidazoline decarboxylase [Bacteroidia bacterium]|nr:2-oxo-4-hydroxy-4-carboxy-5-ureidoimidazoline decarboxylase [Bacteroidia bacterium]
MTFERFNSLPAEFATEDLMRCCGASKWAAVVAEARPYVNLAHILQISDLAWAGCQEEDFLEAFSHHPKIGDTASLAKKFASTATWSEGEQASVKTASHAVIEQLAAGNAAYEARFGFIFIVCAAGKSAAEMLELLNSRLPHDRDTELKIAAAEQNKITHLRLEKLFS